MNPRLRRMWTSAHRGRVLRAAALLGLVLVIGLAAVGGQWLRVARRAQALDSEHAALESAQLESQVRARLAAELGDREQELRALRAQGFMAEADRVGWAESVTSAVESLRPLRYKVAVGAETTLALPPSVQSWYDERGLAAPRLVANLLQLEVDGLHEGEVDALLARARSAGGAVVRVERCRLERRVQGGALAASCTLRRFALLAPQAPQATPTPETST